MRERWFFRALEHLVTFVDLVPVHNAPPGLQIFGAAVVVLKIVGVLPHVVAEDGVQSLTYRIVLIGRSNDLHFTLGIAGEPYPSAAELLHAGLVELRLEIFEVTERLGDHLGDWSGGFAA